MTLPTLLQKLSEILACPEKKQMDAKLMRLKARLENEASIEAYHTKEE